MPPIILQLDAPAFLGAIEIGAFTSIFLFGTVVMQGYFHFNNCKNDPKLLFSFVRRVAVLISRMLLTSPMVQVCVILWAFRLRPIPDY